MTDSDRPSSESSSSSGFDEGSSQDSSLPAEQRESEDDYLDESTIREFIQSQREETQVRKEELRIRERELELNKEQAEKSIQAQVEDRKSQREYWLERERMQQRYGLVFVLALLSLLGFLVWNGNTQIALELVRIAVFGGGGYYAGKKVGESKSDD